jgi:multiple sugar transport system permease protein
MIASPSTSQSVPMTLEMKYSRWQRRFAPYIFVSPFFLLFLFFGLFPMIFSMFISVHKWNPIDGLGNWQFVGLENYQFLIQDDTYFQKSLVNTVVLGLMSVVPQHLIAIPLAVVIHTGLQRIKSAVTAVYFAPYVTSVAAISTVFLTLYSERSGVFNYILQGMNQIPVLNAIIPDEPVRWLGQASMVKPSIALLIIWRYTGWNTVLYLSGLQAIPQDLYEAASVDGANKLQQFRFITLPLLRPIAFFAVTASIIGSMQTFVEPIMMVNGDGGVSNAGLTTMMYLYKTAFTDLDMGLASAISWLLFAIIIIMTMVNNRFFAPRKGE